MLTEFRYSPRCDYLWGQCQLMSPFLDDLKELSAMLKSE
jgi:hypothetical protein